MLDEVRHRAEEVRLTARQSDCVALVARGFSSKEIARELGISPSTVDNHIATAMHQYGFSNRNAVARWYRETFAAAGESAGTAITPDAQMADPGNIGARVMVGTIPMGGIRNSLSLKERILSVAHVSILSIMATSAAVTFVLGLIFLLKLRM